MDYGIILELIGGLGFFLYGMKMMSDGLENAAGVKLRGILEMVTKNRLVGTLIGVLFCAVVQSSSATTVMVVSFVNSGLMSLSQAAGVIMGANIGTTVTSQLVSLNLSELAPVFLMIGVICVMFCKNQKITKIGEVILGFGTLFMGLSMMSGSMSSLRESPMIVETLASMRNPMLGLLAGFVITGIIQSSSVTVSIVLLMAQQGLLELNMCFYIILGCNIGSCLSAMIASLGGKKIAKRAAWIHLLFNIFGSVFIVVVLLLAGDWVEALIWKISGDNIGRAVANTHTIFKFTEVVVLFPFADLIVKMTEMIIPGNEKNTENDFELQYIGEKNVFSPATAVVEVTNELGHMGHLAMDNLNRGMNALITMDDRDIGEVYKVEKNINFLNHAITDFLVKLSQTQIPVDDAGQIGALFHVANDIERIGDHAENFADAARQRKEENIPFSDQGIAELGEMMEKINKILQYSLDCFENSNMEHLEEVKELEEEIDILERKLQQRHVDRMSAGQCTPAAGMIFSDVMSGLERVGDHATNIAFSLIKGSED
ncbi:MAG: Na/Pi cotransporter family protein [Lachnospiraceae bacterium]